MYSLKYIKPDIVLMDFDNDYDLAMYFLRYQEYYESSSSKFRGKSFKLLDFMEWYSKQNDRGCFTYPEDWAGFNLPGSIILDVHKLGIKDINAYDNEMLRVYKKIVKISPKFYLIGTNGANSLAHEVAHGLFYTNIKYKKSMTQLVKALSPSLKQDIIKQLTALGYAKHVHIDECQAYLSTGYDLHTSAAIKNSIDKARQPFIKLFNSYYK